MRILVGRCGVPLRQQCRPVHCTPLLIICKPIKQYCKEDRYSSLTYGLPGSVCSETGVGCTWDKTHLRSPAMRLLRRGCKDSWSWPANVLEIWT